ncbi:MAG: sugar ABC transporter permease [Rhodobacteraceae bacterium]|nr:sugar ABC transporter permease [Paracoccaceae bacterium]
MTATSDPSSPAPAPLRPADLVPPPVAIVPPPSTNRRFASYRTIAALILREMSATYGRSPGGYLWMIVEPVLGIALLTAIFSAGFRTPSLGTNFAIFYATGLLPFQMYSALQNNISSAVRYSRSLLAYPGVTFVDTLIARFVLTVLTQALVSFILISFIRAVYETQTVLEFSTILQGYAMIICIGTGIGLMNGFLFMRYELWARVWAIVTRPLVFVSGVILLVENIPKPYSEWLQWNPLVHAIARVRTGFYVHYSPPYIDEFYVYTVATVIGVVGMLFLSRHYRELLEI